MSSKPNTEISVTITVTPDKLVWLSKLFCMMDDATAYISQDGSLAGKKIDEIQEIIDDYMVKRDVEQI
jgi:hypothetical protein